MQACKGLSSGRLNSRRDTTTTTPAPNFAFQTCVIVNQGCVDDQGLIRHRMDPFRLQREEHEVAALGFSPLKGGSTRKKRRRPSQAPTRTFCLVAG